MEAAAAPPITRLQQAALIAVMVAALTEALTTAFNIGAILTRFEASAAGAGTVATAQGLCTALAALTGTRLITRFSARRLIGAGLVLVAAGHALSLLAQSIAVLAACQALGGLGTGLVICVVMATAARAPKPEMIYGLINASVGLSLSLLALTVPRLLMAGGFAAAYGFYALFAAAALLCLPAIPDTRAPDSLSPGAPAAGLTGPRPAATSPRASQAGWIALIGMGIFYATISSMGAFIERIGVAAQVPLPTIGFAFFVGGLLTIVGPIAAGLVGARFGSTRPLMVVGALMGLAAFGLALSGSTAGYLLCIPLWIVLPAVLTPSFLGGLAVIDRSGKLAGAQPAFATLGGSLGPMSAGAVVDMSGYGGLGFYVLAILAAALSLMAIATTRADALRGQG